MASSKTVFINDFDHDRQPKVTTPGGHTAVYLLSASWFVSEMSVKLFAALKNRAGARKNCHIISLQLSLIMLFSVVRRCRSFGNIF